MKLVVRSAIGTRYIEFVQSVEVVPDDKSPSSTYISVDSAIADDGGFVLILKEEDANGLSPEDT